MNTKTEAPLEESGTSQPRWLWIALAAFALCAMAAAAASASPMQPGPFATSDSDYVGPWTQSSRLSSRELAQASEQEPSTEFLSSYESEAPRRWWPVLLSAVIPGLGETATGYRRGWFLMAADAGLWAGVKNQNDKGNDKEDEFEAFADQHWLQSRWEDFLAAGDLQEYFGYPAGTGPESVALYVSKEQDAREWYENLGKWDVFAWGWEEYWQNDWDPINNSLGGSPGNPVFNTPLRQQYIDMRGASNDAFRNRDRFLTAALLLRVASMLESAYLEGFIGGRYKGAKAEVEGPSSGWIVEPRGLDGARLGWKVSY